MRIAGVALVCAMVLSGCAKEGEPELPPLTADPSYPIFNSGGPVAAEPEPESAEPSESAAEPDAAASLAARTVLQRFLRGAGAGDAKVCAWVAPAFDRARFAAEGGCAGWVAGLSGVDKARLRGVKVPAAAAGAAAGEWVVRPADLVWAAGPAASPSPHRYVLRRTGGRWLLAA